MNGYVYIHIIKRWPKKKQDKKTTQKKKGEQRKTPAISLKVIR